MTYTMSGQNDFQFSFFFSVALFPLPTCGLVSGNLLYLLMFQHCCLCL